jgi:hypothetical protein
MSFRSVGAVLASAVTFVVSPEGEDSDTGKADQARKLGVPIITPAQLFEQYGIGEDTR